MRLNPQVSAKPLNSAVPGELVRVLRPQGAEIGIVSSVSDGNGQPVVICLEGDRFATVPIWYGIDPIAIVNCLSYGTEYFFEVSDCKDFAEQQSDKFGTNGAILAGTKQSLLRIDGRNRQSGPYDGLYYDIANGTAQHAHDGVKESLALLSWKIMLPSQHGGPKVFFSFDGTIRLSA